MNIPSGEKKEEKMNILEQIDQGAIEPIVVAAHSLGADIAHHVCTEVAAIDESGDEKPFWRDEGMTLWMWPTLTSSSALLAWDWVASASGVIARRTVAFCYSNIELLGADHQPLVQPENTLTFAKLIHGLPWQSQVQREIDRLRVPRR